MIVSCLPAKLVAGIGVITTLPGRWELFVKKSIKFAPRIVGVTVWLEVLTLIIGPEALLRDGVFSMTLSRPCLATLSFDTRTLNKYVGESCTRGQVSRTCAEILRTTDLKRVIAVKVVI